ncbi:MAG: hypothetical protein M1453_05905, partial [Acidobacteria bacterium]|nr:hypothetical protein [Acidobacteriota bacterium]
MNPCKAMKRVAAAFLLALMFSVAAGAAEPVEYELRFGKPSSHLLEITVRAGGLKGAATEFAMPAWAPGSYVVNDYAKNVQGFRAMGAGGKELAWRKMDKQTWRVETGGTAAVTVVYKLYANTLANNWAQYNEQHAFLGGPAVWMYLVGGKERPVRLVIAPPAGWRVATGMVRMAENTFAAADYDTFADAPLEISDYAEKTFAEAGSTYHVVVHDIVGKKDFSQFAADTQKIVAATVPMFAAAVGGTRAAPYDEYWFLFHIWPGSGGGLEHLNSTQINSPRDWDSEQMRPSGETDYESKLGVTSHEFFHGS